MTREETLDNTAKEAGYVDAVDMICINGSIDPIYDAMSEFAQQEVIAFAEWVNTDFKAMVKSASDRQDKTEFARLVKLTTTELYQIFKTRNNG